MIQSMKGFFLSHNKKEGYGILKTYVADPKIARKWYLKKRKAYKTYWIGMVMMWGALCLILLLDLSFLLRADGIEQLVEVLLLCLRRYPAGNRGSAWLCVH